MCSHGRNFYSNLDPPGTWPGRNSRRLISTTSAGVAGNPWDTPPRVKSGRRDALRAGHPDRSAFSLSVDIDVPPTGGMRIIGTNAFGALVGDADALTWKNTVENRRIIEGK